MKKFIPYGKQNITDEDIKEVVNVLKRDWITTGPKVKEFEEKFAEYVNAKYAVAVSNGTAALELAVQSLNMEENSEIITTPFTFLATANCILYNKCKPLFVDIKKDTYNINPLEIKKKITANTKAIIYVNYAGQPCDIEEIKQIAKENNLFLIEDAAHAVGAEYKSKKVGNFADLTIFSFHPVKHITTGEGGMITTNNKEFYKKLLMLRNHGIDKDCKERFGPNSGWSFDMKYLGRNYRITDFQCALGISQLKKIDDIIEKREAILKKYNEAFKDNPKITIPFVKENVRSAWHLYTILLNGIDRDEFFKQMRRKNIGVNVHYIPIYHHSYYKEKFSFQAEEFPITEKIFKKIITLPLFPTMTDEQINYVIKTVQELTQNV